MVTPKENKLYTIIIKFTEEVKQLSTMGNNAQYAIPHTNVYTLTDSNVKTGKQTQQWSWKLILQSAREKDSERCDCICNYMPKELATSCKHLQI
jgi:hypothetical protein